MQAVHPLLLLSVIPPTAIPTKSGTRTIPIGMITAFKNAHPTINQNNIPIGPIVNSKCQKMQMIGIPELYRRIIPYVARPLIIGLLAMIGSFASC